MNLAMRNIIKRNQISQEIIPCDSDNQSIIYQNKLNEVVTDNRFLRPNLSDSLQNTRPHKNMPIEYIPCEYGVQASLTQK
jgi:hypothetical protein